MSAETAETTKKTRTNPLKPLMPAIYKFVIGPSIENVIKAITAHNNEVSTGAKHADPIDLTPKNIHAHFLQSVTGDPNANADDVPLSSFRVWMKELGYKTETVSTVTKASPTTPAATVA